MIKIVNNISSSLFIKSYYDNDGNRCYYFSHVRIGNILSKTMFCGAGIWDQYIDGIMDSFDRSKWGL